MKDHSTREELRKELTEKWEKIVNTLIYPKDENEYVESDEAVLDEGEFIPDEAFYENWRKLLSETKEYFDTLPVRGSMSTEDFDLFETVASFRYLSSAVEKDVWSPELFNMCMEIWEVLDSLESVST